MRDLFTGFVWTLGFGLAALACIAAGLWWYCLGVPGQSFDGPLPPLSETGQVLAVRLKSHVQAIASVPHNTLHPEELEAAARYIEGQLAAAGLKSRSLPYQVEGQTVRNIEAVIEPSMSSPGTETLVIGAHYDSVSGGPGANDNASGSAAVLELARLFAQNRPKIARIRFVLFVNEEQPYFSTDQMGSLVYARALAASGERIRAMLSLETLGFYSEAENSQQYPWPLGYFLPSTANFVAFVGTLPNRALVHEVIGGFRRVAQIPSAGGVAPAVLDGIDWSDHWAFGEIGIPAIMVTDTAFFRYPYYHTVHDTPDKIDYERLARVVEGLDGVVREIVR